MATAFVAIKYGGFIGGFAWVIATGRPKIVSISLLVLGVGTILLSQQGMAPAGEFLLAGLGMVAIMAPITGLLFRKYG